MSFHGWGESRPFLNSKLVKKEMWERGWSVADLAEELQVCKSSVWSWLGYQTKPSQDLIDALADILGIPPARLLVEPEKATDKMLECYQEHTAAARRYRWQHLRRQGTYNTDLREALAEKHVAQSAIASMLGMTASRFAKMLHERELPIAMKSLIMDYADAIKVDKAREQEHLRELALHAIGSHDLTQTEIARAAGMPLSTLNRWITGGVMMTDKRLEIITEAIEKIEEEQHE